MGAVRAPLPDRTREAPAQDEPEAQATVEPAGCAVWVDGTRAVVVRWIGHAVVDRVDDEVPARHRSTGHVRHDPTVRHGGGGLVTDQLERDRIRHRRAHLRRVAALVPDRGPVLVVGPGLARLELERALVATDRRSHRERPVVSEPSGRLSDRELIARLRANVGAAPGRRRVGRS